jgi:hypothetical protein
LRKKPVATTSAIWIVGPRTSYKLETSEGEEMSDGLIEDGFTNRPDDDELAFVHFEKMFRVSLDAELGKLQENEKDEYWDSYNHFMQTYINSVLASVRALDIDILRDWINNPNRACDPDNFRQIKFDIDSTITEIKVRHASIIRKASVRIDNSIREKIRELINKIKITLDAIDIPGDRKESLLNKLNAFAAEVDRDRTRFEAYGALVIDAADVVAKVEKKLRPVRRWIEGISKLMHEAREIEEKTAQLPSPNKRLEPPKRQIPPPQKEAPQRPRGGDNFNDDIPF